MMMIIIIFQIQSTNCLADHKDGEVIIRYEDNVSDNIKKQTALDFNLLLKKRYRLTNSELYETDGKSSIVDLKKDLEKLKCVKYVSLNYIFQNQAYDPDFSKQWYLKNTGQIVRGKEGTVGIDIGWEGATYIYSKSKDCFVAVLDSGFAANHDELKYRHAFAPLEYYGETGVDDDGNGYIDDIWGWDFVDNNSSPYDVFGHGTEVSSIIAANHDNKGIEGISSDAFIFALKVGDDKGPKLSAIIEALEWIYLSPRRDIRVVNMSVGTSSNSAILKETIQQFEKYNRVLFVSSAGNGGEDRIGDNIDLASSAWYPSSFDLDCLISVGSVDNDGQLAEFSNFGSQNVDLVAPGTNIRVASVNKEIVEVVYAYKKDFFQGFAGNSVGKYWSENYSNGIPILYSPSGLYLGEISTLLNPIELSLRINPTLKLYANYRLTSPSSVHIYGAKKLRGVNEFKLISLYGQSNGFESIELPLSDFSLSDQLFLRFAFLKTNENDFFNFAGFDLLDIRPADFSGQPHYTYSSGTSFSAPIVSAIASMIFSDRPDLLASDVKQILMNTSMKLSNLEGKIASGGLVRADAALAKAKTLKKRVFVGVFPTYNGDIIEDLELSENGEILFTSSDGKIFKVGSIKGEDWYFEGETVNLELTLNEGWVFNGWEDLLSTEKSQGKTKSFVLGSNQVAYLADFSPDISDNDNDGIAAFIEIFEGSNPELNDTDGDGLNDGDEIFLRLNSLLLSPNIDNTSVIKSINEIIGVESSQDDWFAGFNEAIQSVIQNPSAYNLFTSEQYEQALQSLDTNATPYTSDWFYTPEQGWMWSQKGVYPWFYDANSSNWMYFKSGHDNPRFYNHGTKEWMTLE